MLKLKDIATQAVFHSIMRWKVEEMDDVQTKNEVQLIAYFDKLPRKDREKLLADLNLTGFWDENIREREARDVALFLHEEQQEIKMEFSSQNFDLEFLLKVSGHKLKNLEDLELPRNCTLTANACKQMRQSLPNLEALHISKCVVEDAAIMYLAQLPLLELYAIGDMEYVVTQLCGEDSTIRKTLEVLSLSSYKISAKCISLVLNTMELVEDLGFCHSKWLKALSPIDSKQYNIRQLDFDSPGDEIQEELDIAMRKCPKVSEIYITPDVLTPNMLHTLTEFKELRSLHVHMSLNSGVDEDESRVCLRGLRGLSFDKLTKFHLGDLNGGWMSSGHFLQVLGMCPNLKKLHLSYCYGFNNKIAREFAELMAKKKLKTLKISFCDLLGPSAIEDLFKIASLVKLDVKLRVNELRKLHFDAEMMQQTAERHGVNLQLRFLPWFNDGSDDVSDDDGDDGDDGDGGDVGD